MAHVHGMIALQGCRVLSCSVPLTCPQVLRSLSPSELVSAVTTCIESAGQLVG